MVAIEAGVGAPVVVAAAVTASNGRFAETADIAAVIVQVNVVAVSETVVLVGDAAAPPRT